MTQPPIIAESQHSLHTLHPTSTESTETHALVRKLEFHTNCSTELKNNQYGNICRSSCFLRAMLMSLSSTEPGQIVRNQLETSTENRLAGSFEQVCKALTLAGAKFRLLSVVRNQYGKSDQYGNHCFILQPVRKSHLSILIGWRVCISQQMVIIPN